MESHHHPSGQHNPQLSAFTAVMAWIEALILVVGGLGLLLQPTLFRSIWPWELTPFNAAFIGAIYTSSLIAVALLGLNNRWSPARLVLPMIAIFTILVLIMSVLYFSRFRTGPGTLSWFVLYILLVVTSGYGLWRYRSLAPAAPARLPPMWRRFLLLQGIVATAYGVALLLLPTAASSFWPWPLDDFHGRLYSAIFLAAGAGSLLAWRSAAPEELRTLGATQTAFGLLVIVGAIVVDLGVHRFNYAAPGTWLWLAIFAIAVAGGVTTLALSGAAGMRAAPSTSPAKS